MATSAFKSTTKRMSIGGAATPPDDSASTNRNSVHRRSRSLSRFSHRIPSSNAVEDFDEVPAPRGRFVNTIRGSGFPEISLDDLAIEFFSSGGRGRSASKNSEQISGSGGSASQRRGRSVSRQGSRISSRVNGGGGDTNSSICSSNTKKGVSDSTPRRRRSVSVVRYQISDSESDLEQSQNYGMRANRRSFGVRNNQMPVTQKPHASNNKSVLRRSLTQKDLLLQEGYSVSLYFYFLCLLLVQKAKKHLAAIKELLNTDFSGSPRSHSSVLTDDEGRDGSFINNKLEKTLQAIYSKAKAEHGAGDKVSKIPEALRKELRHAVEGIQMELEQEMGKRKSSISADSNSRHYRNSDVLKSVCSVRENYSSKLEQSEKRKQDLMAEIVLEEQRGRELSKIVKGLLPDPNDIAVEKPSRKSTDKSRMSKRLTEEAEKYIEDFISNVEDTDFSSIDGERSDTTSSLGGMTKLDAYQSPPTSNSLAVDMDGVLLPWLKWETNNDSSPLSCKNKTEPFITPKPSPGGLSQKSNDTHYQSNHSGSSHGSWSPGMIVSKNKKEESSEFQKQSSVELSRGSCFDLEEFKKLQSDEEFLMERWNQQRGINSGRLLLCHQMLF